MLTSLILPGLALISLALLIWQWLVATRFPLHQRVSESNYCPPVTLLKPLKGCEAETGECLRSWLRQDYPAKVQVLFGVASADDPVCAVVYELLAAHPGCDSQLVLCPEELGANAKVSTLVQLHRQARHALLVISDADVRVPADFLKNVVTPLQQPDVGLVNCFYRLANPATLPMQWEAVAINADFWSQVLQAQSLKPLDFALGAVMAVRRESLEGIGGFQGRLDYLADDYQLGHLIAKTGARIVLCPVVVDCWSPPMTWAEVWTHQLRWARTIRVCQPVPYFFSVLSNATLWPLLWLASNPSWSALGGAIVCLFIRMTTAHDLRRRLARSSGTLRFEWMAVFKDLFQTAIWLLSFFGSRIEWRGQRYRLRRDGKLELEGTWD